jgi:hypothetical protein
LKVSTRDDNVQQTAHVVRRQGHVTNHAEGGQKVVQLTSRWVFNAVQSNVQIAGDKDIIGQSHKSGEDIAQFDEKIARHSNRSRTVDGDCNARKRGTGDPSTYQLKSGGSGADVKDGKVHAPTGDGGYSTVIRRQGVGLHAGPRALDYLESFSAKTRDANRVSVVPGFGQEDDI